MKTKQKIISRNGNISRHGFPILCLLNMNCDIELANATSARDSRLNPVSLVRVWCMIIIMLFP